MSQTKAELEKKIEALKKEVEAYKQQCCKLSDAQLTQQQLTAKEQWDHLACEQLLAAAQRRYEALLSISAVRIAYQRAELSALTCWMATEKGYEDEAKSELIRNVEARIAQEEEDSEP